MLKYKLIFILSILIASFLVSTLTLAQDGANPNPTSAYGELNERGFPEGVPSSTEELKNITQTKWDYLGKEWRKILLENSIISKIDSFLSRISIVFRILFGMDYALSMTLLFVIILWLIVFLKSSKMIAALDFLKGWAAYIIGLLFALTLAHLKVFKIIINAVGVFIFSKEAAWARTLLIIASVLIILAFYYFLDILSTYINKKNEEKKKRKAEQEEGNIIEFSDKFKEGQEIAE
ncbi:hypothetical protein HYW76_00340 [Candidatus Pacearchaeota archaeon]|nr:hypothetical protein [Candidatus Pacearchaeota archaeon]